MTGEELGAVCLRSTTQPLRFAAGKLLRRLLLLPKSGARFPRELSDSGGM